MGDYDPLDPFAWPANTPNVTRAWYEAGIRWMRDHGKPSLPTLGHRLWETAAKRRTITYGELGPQFKLSPRGNAINGIGWWAGLVSQYCDVVMGHVYLSAVLVARSTMTWDHPQGIPARGFYSESVRTAKDREREALDLQAEVWAHCSRHPNPFPTQ